MEGTAIRNNLLSEIRAEFCLSVSTGQYQAQHREWPSTLHGGEGEIPPFAAGLLKFEARDQQTLNHPATSVYRLIQRGAPTSVSRSCFKAPRSLGFYRSIWPAKPAHGKRRASTRPGALSRRTASCSAMPSGPPPHITIRMPPSASCPRSDADEVQAIALLRPWPPVDLLFERFLSLTETLKTLTNSFHVI